MRILIFTSKNHIYANFLLKKLFESYILKEDEIIVWEQDWIIPNKTKLAGLIKYIKKSGVYYVFMQMLKQYLFLVVRFISYILNNNNSIFFPYYIKANNYTKKFRRDSIKGLKRKSIQSLIKRIGPDLILSLYSKEIIPQEIIDIPKYGCYNLHAGKLPEYRGISPTFWSMVNNEKFAAVTLHIINTGIDTGRIVFQKRIVNKFKTEHSLYIKLTALGCCLVIELINNIKRKKKIISKPNPINKGKYYSIPAKSAVKKFLSHKNKFFKLSEFLNL